MPKSEIRLNDMAAPLKVALVSREQVGTTGTSRYAATLAHLLAASGVQAEVLSPELSFLPGFVVSGAEALGIDLRTFLSHYPLRVTVPSPDVIHLTSQNLATLLMTPKFRSPVVVTVHDIIPLLLKDNQRFNAYRHAPHQWFDALAMRGLKRADALMADSEWTRRTLIDELRIPEGRVTVVPLGVDTTFFTPSQVTDSFRETYGLPQKHRYLLYVGSEDRRKNLDMLLQSFVRIHGRYRNAILLFVGGGRDAKARARLQNIARGLGIDSAIRWIDHVPEADLPQFYSLADLLVMPSLYEGFGLPVLEAMACGTRVVCVNRTALPEVAGADSVLSAPIAEEFAAAIEVGLAETPDPTADAGARRQWAEQFSWERMVERVNAVYQSVVSS